MNIYELTSRERDILQQSDERAEAFLAITRVIEKLQEEVHSEHIDELGTRQLNLELKAEDVGFGNTKSL